MMTFSPFEMAAFFAARSRAQVSALDAIRDLESRNVCSAPTVRKATVMALCESHAAKAGVKLRDLTSHQLAGLLVGNHPPFLAQIGLA